MLWLFACTSPVPPDAPSHSTTTVDDSTTDTGRQTSPTADTGARFDWPANALVLRDATLVDAAGSRGPLSVVVADGLITWIGVNPGPAPADATTIDAAGRWVSPGLIDPHVHLFLSGTAVWVGDTVEANVQAQLARGVTSMVDAGGPLVSVALRDRFARTGRGPSLKVMGPMLTVPGSHPCESVDDPTFCAYATSPSEAAQVATRHLNAGTDGIKAALADAAFSPWPTPRFDPLSLQAAALAHPGPVLVHVDTVVDAVDALDAGATVLGHPVFGGPALGTAAADVASRAHAVHTTIGAFSGTLDLLDGRLDLDAPELPERVRANWTWLSTRPYAFDPAWLSESAVWWSTAETSVAELRAAGGVLLPASDAGYYYVAHGLGLHQELARLQGLGWSPQELLTATTQTAAAVNEWQDRGSVEVGMRADLLVLTADPLADIVALRDPEWVIVAGDARPPEDWRSADLSGLDDGVCLSADDCSSGGCDRIAHECADPCDPGTALQDPTCGPGAACLPDDALDGSTVCRTLRTCDPLAPIPCSTAVSETCVRFDIDTYACIPS